MISLWSVLLPGGPPQKELEVHAIGSLVLSPDSKLAAALLTENLAYYVEIWDLTTHRVLHRLPLDVSYAILPTLFSPEGKAVVGSATTKGGNALRYQPIDGSPAHLLTDPTHDDLTFFAWSPSGRKLAVLQLRQSSDVVLITDLTGKQPR